MITAEKLLELLEAQDYVLPITTLDYVVIDGHFNLVLLADQLNDLQAAQKEK